MELLSRLIIGKKSKNPEKRDIIWNMAGSFLYAFASMVLSIAVVQIAGEDAGGIFTFAFTTFGQHMFMMAYFGIRPFQITDTGGKYSFGDYLGLRLLTCGAAVLTGMGYVFLNGYSFEKAAVVFLMVVYKVIDALADAYEAEFQRGGRLYLTGKSNAFRTILSVGVYERSGRRQPVGCGSPGGGVPGVRRAGDPGASQRGVEIGEGKEAGAFCRDHPAVLFGSAGLLYFFRVQIRH